MSDARSVAGRVPPNDLDAEAATLSACLLDGEVVDVVLPILGVTGERFYSAANGMIWEGIVKVHEMRQGVDIVSVASWLREKEWLAQVGGAKYLAQLSDATPAVAHIETHAGIVFEMWRLRQLIAQCQRTAAEGYGDIGGSVTSFIDAHMQHVEEISRGLGTRQELALASNILKPVLAELETTGSLFGISTGYARLDALIAGLHRGHLALLAARPGMGKTAFAVEMAMRIARAPTDREDPDRRQVEYAVPVFSLEMPRKDLVLRMACSRGNVSMSKLRQGAMDVDDWRRLVPASEEIATMALYIDDTPGATVADVRRKVRKLKTQWERDARVDARGVRHRERRLGPVLVDYLQLMRGRGSETSREQEIGNCSQDLKELAKELDTPIVALAQLNRDLEKRSTKDRRPQLSDLRDSGRLEQDADLVIFVHRQHYYEPHREEIAHIAELIVRKQRSGATNGRVLMRFVAECTRFDEFRNDEYQQAAFSLGDS